MSKAVEQRVSELEAKVDALIKSLETMAERMDRFEGPPQSLQSSTLKLKRG